jgi:hypothetical protein
MEARIKVIKGWILNLAIATTIKTRMAKIIISKFIESLIKFFDSLFQWDAL